MARDAQNRRRAVESRTDIIIRRNRTLVHHACSQCGIALLVVLWFIVILTVLATAAATLSALHRRAAQSLGDEIRLGTAADSAIRVELLELSRESQLPASLLHGATRRFNFSGIAVTAHIHLEDGRIDLNTGSSKLLLALFAANGWSQRRARRFVKQIDVWKAPAGDPRQVGREIREYEATGRQYSPRYAPFNTVGELRQVIGGERVSRKLMGALTVYSHAKYPLQAAAPPEVLRALRWADRHRLGNRRWLVSGGNSPTTDSGYVENTAVGRLIRVRACARFHGAARCRVAVVRLTGNFRNPFEIFLWRSQ